MLSHATAPSCRLLLTMLLGLASTLVGCGGASEAPIQGQTRAIAQTLPRDQVTMLMVMQPLGELLENLSPLLPATFEANDAGLKPFALETYAAWGVDLKRPVAMFQMIDKQDQVLMLGLRLPLVQAGAAGRDQLLQGLKEAGMDALAPQSVQGRPGMLHDHDLAPALGFVIENDATLLFALPQIGEVDRPAAFQAAAAMLAQDPGDASLATMPGFDELNQGAGASQAVLIQNVPAVHELMSQAMRRQPMILHVQLTVADFMQQIQGVSTGITFHKRELRMVSTTILGDGSDFFRVVQESPNPDREVLEHVPAEVITGHRLQLNPAEVLHQLSQLAPGYQTFLQTAKANGLDIESMANHLTGDVGLFLTGLQPQQGVGSPLPKLMIFLSVTEQGGPQVASQLDEIVAKIQSQSGGAAPQTQQVGETVIYSIGPGSRRLSFALHEGRLWLAVNQDLAGPLRKEGASLAQADDGQVAEFFSQPVAGLVNLQRMAQGLKSDKAIPAEVSQPMAQVLDAMGELRISATRQGQRMTGVATLPMSENTLTQIAEGVSSLVQQARAATQRAQAGPQPVQVYFYDLNTDQLFTSEANQIAPIPAPSGPLQDPDVPPNTPAGVKAYVFACGDCSVEENRFIGYLEMYAPEAKAKMEAAAKAMERDQPIPDIYLHEEGWMEGRLIKRPGDKKWVVANSEAGIQITLELSKKCPRGVRLKPCFPR